MKAFKFLSNTAIVVSLALLASCSSDDDIQTSGKKLEFKANLSEVTRVTLASNNDVHWDENDQIAVFSDNYEYPGLFAITPSSIDGTTATFANYEEASKTLPEPEMCYYASYPLVSATFRRSTSMITSALSANQVVTSDRTYDKNALIMVACADREERIFNFKNVPALVKVNVSGNADGKVKYIEIVAKNTANRLSGSFEATVNYMSQQLKVNVNSDSDIKNTVRLEIPASNESKDFYLAVLPGYVNNGLTLKFEGDNGASVYELSSDNDVTFKSSKIYPFGSYNVAEFPVNE